MDHLAPASLEGPAAVGVFGGEDAGLLVTEWAGAGGGFQEVGEGHEGVSRVWAMVQVPTPVRLGVGQWGHLREVWRPPLAARYEFCRESIYCLGESVSPTRLTVNWVVPSS